MFIFWMFLVLIESMMQRIAVRLAMQMFDFFAPPGAHRLSMSLCV